MKEVKTYTNIWRVERTFYAFNDIRLPRPVSVTFIFWFLAVFFLSLVMDGIPPFVFDGVLVNNIAIPIFAAWFMNKKTFDGKKPYSFVKSAVSYFFMPKLSVRGKHVEIADCGYTACITVGKAGGRKQLRIRRKEEKRERKERIREEKRKRREEKRISGRAKGKPESVEDKVKEKKEGRCGVNEVSS